MAEKKTPKKAYPPYLPYKTIGTFIDSLKVALPQRIDRSLMKSMSGGMQSALMSALAYLDLINSDTGAITEKLNRLVHSEGAERQRGLQEILTGSYPFIFEDGLQLDRATTSQLEERFKQSGASGDTLRKSVTFFLKAAKDAGLKVSPHIKGVRVSRAGVARQKRSSPEKSDSPISKEPAPIQSEEVSWEKSLLSKFPSFDPAWPEEVQKKWFDGFKELMALGKKSEE
jgi:hypothetical protein